MKSVTPRRIGSWILVLFLLTMSLFAIWKVVNSPTEQKVDSTVENALTQINSENIARTKAVAMAEKFTIDYYSYSEGQDDSYISSLKSVYADGVTVTPPTANCSCNFASAINVSVDGQNVDVDVLARVTIVGKDKTTTQYLTLRVPMRADDDGNVAVVANPFTIATPNSSSKIETVMTTQSTNADDADAEAISTLVDNYFTAYYSGKSSELEYYVTQNYGQPLTLGKSIAVTDVDERIFIDGEGWLVECYVKINDNGLEETEHCFLTVVKGAENRYYVDSLSTH